MTAVNYDCFLLQKKHGISEDIIAEIISEMHILRDAVTICNLMESMKSHHIEYIVCGVLHPLWRLKPQHINTEFQCLPS